MVVGKEAQREFLVCLRDDAARAVQHGGEAAVAAVLQLAADGEQRVAGGRRGCRLRCARRCMARPARGAASSTRCGGAAGLAAGSRSRAGRCGGLAGPRFAARARSAARLTTEADRSAAAARAAGGGRRGRTRSPPAPARAGAVDRDRSARRRPRRRAAPPPRAAASTPSPTARRRSSSGLLSESEPSAPVSSSRMWRKCVTTCFLKRRKSNRVRLHRADHGQPAAQVALERARSQLEARARRGSAPAPPAPLRAIPRRRRWSRAGRAG